MENHIVLFQSTNHYLQKFSIALTNFEKLKQQEGKRHQKVKHNRGVRISPTASSDS